MESGQSETLNLYILTMPHSVSVTSIARNAPKYGNTYGKVSSTAPGSAPPSRSG